MKERLFRFKQFAVNHKESAMKVGVDAVLLGAWVEPNGARRVLDIGTGCGVIALAIAQRFPGALIDAIDVDTPSIKEATENFLNSPWSNRMKAYEADFSEFKTDCCRYDLIVSNPPFFESGVDSGQNARTRARHVGTLSPYSILESCKYLLNPEGRVAMIVPAESEQRLIETATNNGLALRRIARVFGAWTDAPKRLMLEFILSQSNLTAIEETLHIHDPQGNYTEEYKNLTKDYYIIF